MNKFFLFGLFSLLSVRANCQSDPEIIFRDTTLTISYGKKLLFSGICSGEVTKFNFKQKKQFIKNCEYDIITITSGNFSSFTLRGEIIGSDQSIACESEPLDNGLKIVRHVVGQSRSLLNNAVYDRSEDWLLSFDRATPKTFIMPKEGGHFEFTEKGWEIVIRFRPHYYRDHRELPYFHPAEYAVWQTSVAGWCSWFAYFDKVDEKAMKQTADVLSKKLKPFGLEYLQIDDGYEQLPIGVPSHWLTPNEKFPSGLNALSAYISSAGMVPGIWTNLSFADSSAAYANKTLFVPTTKGDLASGNWVGYVMDGSNPATAAQFITPVYKGLNDGGWRYFKLDAIRHLKYEGYNSYAEYFDQKHLDKNEALRNIVKEVRRQIGPKNFLLACWGIRPELTGLVDACRIGSDGFSYAGLAQFNSYNNIVWRNDPDHIELSPAEAYRSCTATSLTGSLFMLTDRPEKYESSPLIEAARRSLPILFTQPCQVYDVDPSRSALVRLADAELSGSGPRPFDASTSTTTGLFSLEITKPFENWLVLGRLDERDKVIPLKDLGLDEKKEYLAFEFWTKKYLGLVRQKLVPGKIDSSYRCQLVCLREKLNHPQLLATNRHISCGGFELRELAWSADTLHGVSETVAGDPYTLYIHEPESFQFESVQIEGGQLAENEKDGELRKITIVNSVGGMVKWDVWYR